jgi:hypothetical protein
MKYNIDEVVWYVDEEWPILLCRTKILSITSDKRYMVEGRADSMCEKALFPTSKDLINSFYFIDSTTPPSLHSGKTLGECAAEGFNLL